MCQPGRPGPQGDGHDGSPGLARLPQREVERVQLAGRRLDAFAVRELVEAASGQLPVAVELLDGEVDAALAGVRVARRSSSFAIRSSISGMCAGRSRLEVGRQDVQPPHRVLVAARVALRDDHRVDTELVRAVDDLVVDVGDVADEEHVVPAPHEVPAQDVEHDGRRARARRGGRRRRSDRRRRSAPSALRAARTVCFAPPSVFVKVIVTPTTIRATTRRAARRPCRRRLRRVRPCRAPPSSSPSR